MEGQSLVRYGSGKYQPDKGDNRRNAPLESVLTANLPDAMKFPLAGTRKVCPEVPPKDCNGIIQSNIQMVSIYSHSRPYFFQWKSRGWITRRP